MGGYEKGRAVGLKEEKIPDEINRGVEENSRWFLNRSSKWGICASDKDGRIFLADSTFCFRFGVHPRKLTQGGANLHEVAVNHSDVIDDVETAWMDREIATSNGEIMQLVAAPVRKGEKILGVLYLFSTLNDQEDSGENEGNTHFDTDDILVEAAREVVRTNGTLDFHDIATFLEIDDELTQPNLVAKDTRKRRKESETEGPVPDSTTLYLREIGKIPLLSHQEELELAQAIEKGKLDLAEALAREAVDEASRAQEQISHARLKLLTSNLRLVVSIAKKYSSYAVPLLDLIQEGNMALDKAIDGYNWRKGFRFSTYVYPWIKRDVIRGIASTGRLISIPDHLAETINKMRKDMTVMIQDLGREPTEEEIAQEFNISEAEAKIILRAMEEPTSLDLEVGDKKEDTMLDFIPDTDPEITPEITGQNNVLKSSILETLLTVFSLANLNPREQAVLALRFGLGGGRGLKLVEVGAYLGFTKERAHKKEKEALAKINNNKQARALLEGFL